MSALTWLGILGIFCLLLFLNGWRFARMENNPWTGKTIFGLPVEGGDMSVKDMNRWGRWQMIWAVVFFLFFALITSGLLGPFNGNNEGWLVTAEGGEEMESLSSPGDAAI